METLWKRLYNQNIALFALEFFRCSSGKLPLSTPRRNKSFSLSEPWQGSHGKDISCNQCMIGRFSWKKEKGLHNKSISGTGKQFLVLPVQPVWKKLPSPKRLIGKERIWDMVVNVFLPASPYFAKQQKSHSMEKILYQVYNHFPRLSPNRITKFMEEFILGLVKNK